MPIMASKTTGKRLTVRDGLLALALLIAMWGHTGDALAATETGEPCSPCDFNARRFSLAGASLRLDIHAWCAISCSESVYAIVRASIADFERDALDRDVVDVLIAAVVRRDQDALR